MVIKYRQYILNLNREEEEKKKRKRRRIARDEGITRDRISVFVFVGGVSVDVAKLTVLTVSTKIRDGAEPAKTRSAVSQKQKY